MTDAKCIGIEIDEERGKNAQAKILQAGLEKKATIFIGNALDYNFRDATVIFLYLIPRGLKIILPFLQEIPQNFRIVTYMSPFVNIEHEKMLTISPSHQDGAKWPLYLYHFNNQKKDQTTIEREREHPSSLQKDDNEEKTINTNPTAHSSCTLNSTTMDL